MQSILTSHVGIVDIPLFFLACFLVNKLITSLTRVRVPKGYRLPPGPPRKFLIGNALDMPTYHEWETITRWSEQYGDVFYTESFGQPAVFLNSVETVRELLENRSGIYSDRPNSAVMTMQGWDTYVVSMRYGAQYRSYRRTFKQHFSNQVIDRFAPLQTKHIRVMLRNLLASPDDFVAHLRHASASIIVEAVYGKPINPEGDPFIELAHAAKDGFAVGAVPWAFYVDYFPFLKHLPSWLPGMKWKRDAEMWRKPTLGIAEYPINIVKKELVNGTAKPCIAVSSLSALQSKGDYTPEEEKEIINTEGIAYVAGAGTTSSAQTTFILAMILHPEVQKKAQKELDAVLGDRLPGYEDRERLPYINAISEEIQRWRPVLPLSVSHGVIEDDVYKDYFIPKGSIVIQNTWKMLHDEANVGPNPDKFDPERFLIPGVVKPNFTVQWGAGRRICPGRYLASKTLYLYIASVLKVFDISHARDSNGNIIPVDENAYTSGVVVEPERFRCKISIRSDSCRKLIEEELTMMDV